MPVPVDPPVDPPPSVVEIDIARIDALEECVRDLKERVEALEGREELLVENAGRVANAVAELQVTVTNTQTIVNENTANNSDIVAAIEALTSRVDELSGQVSTVQEQPTASYEDVVGMSRRLDKIEKEPLFSFRKLLVKTPDGSTDPNRTITWTDGKQYEVVSMSDDEEVKLGDTYTFRVHPQERSD
jgi:outer membrane murein-binding lipoprotein Lpp